MRGKPSNRRSFGVLAVVLVGFVFSLGVPDGEAMGCGGAAPEPVATATSEQAITMEDCMVGRGDPNLCSIYFVGKNGKVLCSSWFQRKNDPQKLHPLSALELALYNKYCLQFEAPKPPTVPVPAK